jgi:molybdopterin converting factor subunit 1
MGRVRVLFFAAVRDAAECESAEVSWDGDAALTTEELWEKLEARFPRVTPLRRGLRLARNLEYLAEPEALFSGDEVALIPPVSGG